MTILNEPVRTQAPEPQPKAHPHIGRTIILWITSTDHKTIGYLYLIQSFVFFIVAGAMALVIRGELATPGMQIVSLEQYNQLFTMHGTIMLFLFATPLFVGFGNVIMPLQIGAPDVAFPRLNMLGFWLFFFGGLTAALAFFTPGGAPGFGWFAYTPLSGSEFTPQVGADLWLLGLTMGGLGTILGAVNFITTIYCMRAPGMTMFRMPVYTWTVLATSALVLMCFPVLAGALVVLFIDRHFGSVVFLPENGGAMLWQHLFWFFGHPEVYILALPFFGIASEVIPVFSRKPIFGYKGLVLATLAIAGLSKGTVTDTFCDPSVSEPLKAQPIDPPTVTMSFIVNDSPLAGTEGDKVTSRVIRDRLLREAEGNVALKIEESAEKDSFFVSGRGELQLAVLIETMRREGFELAVSRPRVVMQKDEATGETLEPIEEVVIDVDEEHAGVVVQKMSERKAEMVELRPSGGNRQRLVFLAPTRGLIGYQSELLTDTRGTAVMNRLFNSYQPYKGDIPQRVNGVLISNDQGESVAFAMWNLEDRGPMIIDPGVKVYQGMIIGIHSRDNDLEVNVLKGKKLTNVRAAGKDEAVRLTPPIRMTLERALAWIQDDELVEVTPKNIRLRKLYLDPNERKKFEKSSKVA